MKHPTNEQWAPYLFGETKGETRQELRQHLEICPECRLTIENWKRSLASLDHWQLPGRAKPLQRSAPVLKWAAGFAILLVLALGFMLGRFSSPRLDSPQLRAAIAGQLRQELRAELNQALREQVDLAAAEMLAVSAAQTRTLLLEYNGTVDARIEAEKKQRLADCLSLKRDVDTLAINADAGLRNTEQRLAQLTVSSPGSQVSGSAE
jgi:hypothetical protein